MARLVLWGAGHAHLESLLAIPRYIRQGHRVTVVARNRWLYYSGMAPSFLGGRCSVDMARIDVQAIAVLRGAEYIRMDGVAIDVSGQAVVLSDGSRCYYDVLSCNIGSQVYTDGTVTIGRGVGHTIFPAKPVEYLVAARKSIVHAITQRRTLSCAVIGSGAGACEIAGNALCIAAKEAQAHGCKMSVHLYCDAEILTDKPARFRQQTQQALVQRGAQLQQTSRVAAVYADDDAPHADNNLAHVNIRLRDGSMHRADFCFVAVGVQPPRLFNAAGLSVDASGGMCVNRYLQSVSHAAIFGGGDCIAFTPYPLDKVGVYAVRQNKILAHNLGCALNKRAPRIAEHTVSASDMHTATHTKKMRNARRRNAACTLVPFRPQHDYFFALNLGDGHGVGIKQDITLSPRVAFRFKEHFDRAFVRRYRRAEHSLHI